MTTEAALRLIECAKVPADIFAAATFKQLAALCHPDRIEAAQRDRAERAFKRLGEMHALVNGNAPAIKLGKWTVTAPLARGAISDLYLVAFDGTEAVAKIVRTASDNALLAQERAALKTLHADNKTDAFKRYLPLVHDAFEASGRAVNVLSLAQGCLPLTHIRQAFPGGLPFRHVVWMMNRLLEILGYAHSHGLIHGAVLPHHLLYRPDDHGLVLVDWVCSVDFPSKWHIPLVSKKWRAHYPPEVFKKDAYCATDIYMAAAAMWYAASRAAGKGDTIPKRFRGLFEWCTAESPAARPESVFQLHDRWREVALTEYGKPQFVRLDIPVN